MKSRQYPSRFSRPGPRKQRGVLLIISLIALVALTLAAVAFMRAVDTGNLVAGNLAFNRAAVVAGDVGIEQARTWIATNGGSLQANQPGVAGGNAFWAQWQDGFDPRNYDWTNNAVLVSTAGMTAAQQAALAGYNVSYVVHRMCQTTGDPTTAGCVYQRNVSASTAGCNLGTISGLQTLTCGTLAQSVPYFRITTRIAGPRNTETYLQAMLY